MKTLKQEVAELLQRGYSGEDVEAAAHLLNDEARRLRARACALALVEFRPGDLVTVKAENGSRRLPAGIVGKVERLGQKNVSVDFGAHLKWRVPAFWLQTAPEGSKFNHKLVTRESLFGGGRRRRQYQETPPEMA
jgi:hypothetical protein